MKRLIRFFNAGIILPMALSFAPTSANADYIADMIVFEHKSTSPWLEEYWPTLPEKLDAGDKDILVSPNMSGNGWRWLPNSSMSQMASVEKRLSASSDYKVVAHVTWQLPTQTKNNAYTAVVEGHSPETGLPIQARIKIFKQKFEHISLDVQTEKKIPLGVREAFVKKHQLKTETLGEEWRFILQESRKIIPGELQYFDHPQFGVVFMLTTVGGN